MLCAVAMMSWDLKHPEAEISLRVDAEGALAGGTAISSASGSLRGYVFNPSLFLPQSADNFYPGKALGKGTLSILRNDTDKATFTGTCELVSGEIAEDLAHYYAQSEQTPSAVNLGLLIDNEARVRTCGGFIIQQLPFADPAIAAQIEENLQATPNVSDLMDMGLSIQDILSKFVFKGLSWQQNEEKDLRFQCSCSRDKFSKALLLLGIEELQNMQEGIKPVCQYCNTEYEFTNMDMNNLIKELQDKL
jgi:molecular chaperone Hsp33